MRALANRPGFSAPPGLGTTASTVSARWLVSRAGETKRTLPSKVRSGIGIDLERHRLAGAHRRDELLGHGQLHPQRIDPHDDGDLHALGHVVADRDHALSHDARKRRPDDRVGERFLREGDSRACPLQRLVLLCGGVLRHFDLLPHRFHLGPALVEFRLRDHALIEQRLDAGELALRQRVGGVGVLHLGDGVDVEGRSRTPGRAALRFAPRWLRPLAPGHRFRSATAGSAPGPLSPACRARSACR